jgi:hypothetical protein
MTSEPMNGAAANGLLLAAAHTKVGLSDLDRTRDAVDSLHERDPQPLLSRSTKHS